MPRHGSYVPHGVIPAVLLPFENDLSIDEASFRKHLRDVAATEGISAITINAHSTEVASCTFEEQRRVLDVAQDEVGSGLPLVNGIWADGSIEAARIARMAMQGGASALLVFPPAPFTLGQSPAMAFAHIKRIADATDLPLIVFQYPLATGQGYPKDTLLRLCEDVPSIRAIKDWIGNVPHHELHVRTLQNLPRPVMFSRHIVRGCFPRLFWAATASCPAPAVSLPICRRDYSSPAQQRHGRSKTPERSYRADCTRILRRSVRRHAQSHEGSARAARKTAARRGAPAIGQDRARRDRAHSPRFDRVGPAGQERRP